MRSGTVRVVEMCSNSRLPKRHQRSSSSTISLENHEEDEERVKLQGDVDERDLDLVAPHKRMKSVISLHVCASATRKEGQESGRTGGNGDGEFEIEIGEDTGELVAKSSMKISNLNQRGLRSRQLLVSKTSNYVIGARVPRKARSACVKRSLQEYPASWSYKDQPHSYLEAGANGETNEECKSAAGKGSKLFSSVDEDIEMEVAEVLFSLRNQSHQPENVRYSQQKLGVSVVKVSEQINRKIKLWPGNNKPDKTGSSELKLLENREVPVGLEKAETSIVVEGLVEESKKEKSLSQTSLSIGSGNSVYSKESHRAPFAVYQEGEFVRTKERSQKPLPDVKVGKPEKLMTETRSLSVPELDTLLQLEQLNWSAGATRSAQIALSASFPASNDSCPGGCSIGHLQARESIAYMDKATGPFLEGQPRMVYQHGRKRCATHYYIAQSIMYHNPCNFLSFKGRSTCSSVNGSFKKYVSERHAPELSHNGNISSKSPIVTNPTCPHGKEPANAASCLPDADSAQRAKHLNHKGPQVSSSDKSVYQMAGSKADLSGTLVSTGSLKASSPTCSAFLTKDPPMRLYNSRHVTNEGPPSMTIIPSSDYTLPIQPSIESSASLRGRVNGNVMPYPNGTICPPQLFYPPLLSGQPTHPQTLILPSGRFNAGLRGSSSLDKQTPWLQQHAFTGGGGGHTFIQSASMHSPYPHNNRIQSFRHSHKPEAETPGRNSICHDQRSADNQHTQVPLQQMHFTMTPMDAVNNTTKKFTKQELVQGSRVEFQPPASEAVSLSYSPIDGISLPSELSFSLPGQKFSFLPSLADLAHRKNLGSQTASAGYKKYQNEAKGGIDITGADSAGKCFIGNPKEIPYDQTVMVKGCSIFDNTAKNPSFYTAFESAKSQNHYGVQEHRPKGIWNKTSTTNSQPSSAMTTNVPYSSLVTSHPAHWSIKGSSQSTESASIIPPFFRYNNPVPQLCTYGGNNEKSTPDRDIEMSVMHPPPTLKNNQHTQPQKSCQSSSKGRKSASVVLPACEPNMASPNCSSQQKLSSPVCRMAAPAILLSTCPSHISEVKN